jgi:hypothetical protein
MHYAPKPRIAVQGSAKHRSRPEIPGGTSASGLIAAVQFLEAAGGRRPKAEIALLGKRTFNGPVMRWSGGNTDWTYPPTLSMMTSTMAFISTPKRS